MAVALVRSAVGTGAVLPTRLAQSRERPIEQPVKLARHRFWKPAVVALLPRMRDGERKQIAPERRWRLSAELLPPQVAKLGSREPVQIPKIAIRSTSRRHRTLLLPHARSHSPQTPVGHGETREALPYAGLTHEVFPDASADGLKQGTRLMPQTRTIPSRTTTWSAVR